MTAVPRKVFVSYSHHQEEWVRDRLVPVLRAGGAEVLIDYERFGAGRSVLGQMDATQDEADVHVLVFSPDYLASGPCRHEMERAVALDPMFEHGIVVPVMRIEADLPAEVSAPNPIYVDLKDDSVVAPWELLLRACSAELGTAAPAWLIARDEVRRFLVRGQSVNLVTDRGVAWRGLIEDLQRGELADLIKVDLESGAAASRRGLVQEILSKLGTSTSVPPEPEDLVALDRFLTARPRTRIALVHFDFAAGRDTYGVDFFASLRYLAMEARKLTLLVQSRRPFVTLLPEGHPLSEIGLQSVELEERKR